MGGIWIGGETTYFCSFSLDKYYYSDGVYFYGPVPSWERELEAYEPMKHAAPEKLVFWK